MTAWSCSTCPRFARRPADGERLIAAAERGLTILDDGSEYDLTTASGQKELPRQPERCRVLQRHDRGIDPAREAVQGQPGRG